MGAQAAYTWVKRNVGYRLGLYDGVYIGDHMGITEDKMETTSWCLGCVGFHPPLIITMSHSEGTDFLKTHTSTRMTTSLKFTQEGQLPQASMEPHKTPPFRKDSSSLQGFF